MIIFINREEIKKLSRIDVIEIQFSHRSSFNCDAAYDYFYCNKKGNLYNVGGTVVLKHLLALRVPSLFAFHFILFYFRKAIDVILHYYRSYRSLIS